MMDYDPNPTACGSARSAKCEPEAGIFINMYGILPIVKIACSELQISTINSEMQNSAEVLSESDLFHMQFKWEKQTGNKWLI